ncbi:hypothetical protein HX099_10500 [Thiopseudomonas alkaliphila]|uniref:RiboL-PSP-HEPN domain-containing protein n=1 Tax=Thiopseudomonas alkaliphila TaxID=1697053 RepID=A0AAW7DV53_9GAMM|nr:HEPN domain-containing protein [Thiopseudomonas alkaliphila]MDM1697083.1 hypothetical protein [Thiopseudomonas alkaliphila]
MSDALEAFKLSIKDAEFLLKLSSEKAVHESQESSDILKRSTLVMIFTAWETYIEDRVQEAIREKLSILKGSFIETFISEELTESINKLHNPDSAKTKHLFEKFLNINVQNAWKIDGLQPQEVATQLNYLIKKRGESVHRSRCGDKHIVSKQDAEKALSFIKKLVNVTDKYITEQTCPHK